MYWWNYSLNSRQPWKIQAAYLVYIQSKEYKAQILQRLSPKYKQVFVQLPPPYPAPTDWIKLMLSHRRNVQNFKVLLLQPNRTPHNASSGLSVWMTFLYKALNVWRNAAQSLRAWVLESVRFSNPSSSTSVWLTTYLTLDSFSPLCKMRIKITLRAVLWRFKWDNLWNAA